MTVKLNHTIVAAHDKQVSAAFLADILGLAAPTPFGPFLTVPADNGVTLDYADWGDEVAVQHYAFLVDEDDSTPYSAVSVIVNSPIGRIPTSSSSGEINTADGGRGVYFEDPVAIFSRSQPPHGSGSCSVSPTDQRATDFFFAAEVLRGALLAGAAAATTATLTAALARFFAALTVFFGRLDRLGRAARSPLGRLRLRGVVHDGTAAPDLTDAMAF